MGCIKFEKRIFTDARTNRKWDAVAVLRDGQEVSLLPEADRLRRALNLPLEEVQDIYLNFTQIMGRGPSRDEKEFWEAVMDSKLGQCHD